MSDTKESTENQTQCEAAPQTPPSASPETAKPSQHMPKHHNLDVFVLSEAGKPIYCYSSRDDAITLMSLCAALLNYIQQTQNDTLRYITTVSGLRVTFAHKSPLIIVVVSRVNCGIDASIVISQVNAQIMSILTGKTLKSVFEQRPTFDLKRLLTGSEKLIDTLVDVTVAPLIGTTIDSGKSRSFNTVNAYLSCPIQNSRTVSSQSIVSRSTVNRVTVPILLLSSSVRETITNIINSCVSSFATVVFSVLFYIKKPETNLVTVCNHNAKARLSPLDIPLIYSLVIASESQLASVESFWLPLCLPRFDSSAFLHAHISYLNNEFCLALLTTEREDFHKCQVIKDSIIDRLAKVHLSSTQSKLTDLSIPQLQYLWYQSQRQSVVWRQSWFCQFSPLNHYIADRMLSSHLKTFWLRTENDGVLLGWNSPSFQLYAQFDVTITQLEALTAIQSIVKWIKKEEEKFIIKDYQ